MDPLIAAHVAKWLHWGRLIRAGAAGGLGWDQLHMEIAMLEVRMSDGQLDEARRRAIAARTAELEAGQE
jgi:hypothetical protein